MFESWIFVPLLTKVTYKVCKNYYRNNQKVYNSVMLHFQYIFDICNDHNRWMQLGTLNFWEYNVIKAVSIILC